MTADYTRDEMETGRKLFAADWQFFAAASSPESLPKMRGTEIAFAGRSNVGKSSLINALAGRKALARTSRTPGRTQELIFFNAGGDLNLVDMPGYGYAAAAKSKIASWTAMIEAYLHGRANLARVYVLIDSRHGLKDTDDATFKVLGGAAVSYQIILTKVDAIKASELPGRIAEVEAGLAKWPSAFPTVLATSSDDRHRHSTSARGGGAAAGGKKALIPFVPAKAVDQTPVRAPRDKTMEPIFVALAGLMGAAGVILTAAGAHGKPGSGLDSAGYLLLIHAGAAIVTISRPGRAWRCARSRRWPPADLCSARYCLPPMSRPGPISATGCFPSPRPRAG